MAFFSPIFRIGKVLEASDFEKVILDVLDDSGGPVLDQVLHSVERLEDPPPLFWARVELLPEVLHDDGVVSPLSVKLRILPVVRVVCQHLQLRVRNIPVLIGGALLQDLLILRHAGDLVFAALRLVDRMLTDL